MSELQSGHSGQTSKQRHRNRKRTAQRHTPAPVPPSGAPRCDNCAPEDGHKCRTCPLSYAELERDTIQFVIVDQEFRDRLMEKAGTGLWRTKTTRGLTWIYPNKNLTLQAGGDVVTFYSAEPEDLKHITGWIMANFSGVYSDIFSLIERVRRPAELTRDELTVIVTDKETIREIMFSISMRMENTGTYYLKSPNPVTPGFKVYQLNNTLRCEFDCRDDKRKISALTMRRRLLEILPVVAGAPGIFNEFLTDYYNPYEHPIIIDTGTDAIFSQFTKFAENITEKFTEAMREFTQARTVQAELPMMTPEEENKVAAITKAVEELESFQLDEILLAFKRTLRLDAQVAKVFLAAWAAWASRNFKGRVLREDIASVLLRADEPLELAQVADAIDQLIAAGLMRRDKKLEVKFSPGGVSLARKLQARREGLV